MVGKANAEVIGLPYSHCSPQNCTLVWDGTVAISESNQKMKGRKKWWRRKAIVGTYEGLRLPQKTEFLEGKNAIVHGMAVMYSAVPRVGVQ